MTVPVATVASKRVSTLCVRVGCPRMLRRRLQGLRNADGCKDWTAVVGTVEGRTGVGYWLAQKELNPPPDAHLCRPLASFVVFLCLHQLVAKVVGDHVLVLEHGCPCGHHVVLALGGCGDDYMAVAICLNPA